MVCWLMQHPIYNPRDQGVGHVIAATCSVVSALHSLQSPNVYWLLVPILCCRWFDFLVLTFVLTLAIALALGFLTTVCIWISPYHSLWYTFLPIVCPLFSFFWLVFASHVSDCSPVYLTNGLPTKSESRVEPANHIFSNTRGQYNMLGEQRFPCKSSQIPMID